MDSQFALGRHVAERRRREGWTQAELAGMLGRPAGWVSRLEQGLVQAGPGAAGPLPAPVTRHPGQDGRRDDDAGPGQARILRQVLAGGRAGGPRSFPPESLAGTAAQAWDLAEARRYGDLASLLGSLLPDLDAAARAAGEPERAGLHRLAASCYQACAAALARLGDHDSALTAADRALTAAHQAGDALAAAASGYLLGSVLLGSGRHDHAREVASAAAESVKGHAASGSTGAVILRGALTLLLALCAARAGDIADAAEQLGRARVLAGRLSGREVPGTGFGPGHVALYEIAVSIEAGALLPAAQGEG